MKRWEQGCGDGVSATMFYFWGDELCQADLFNQKSNRIFISSVIIP